MPEAWTYWECDTCRKRYSNYDTAAACERDHIVKNVTDNFAVQLKNIMAKGKPDASR